MVRAPGPERLFGGRDPEHLPRRQPRRACHAPLQACRRGCGGAARPPGTLHTACGVDGRSVVLSPGTTVSVRACGHWRPQDIKPANVLLADDGHPVLMDFGSATPARIKVTGRHHAMLLMVRRGFARSEDLVCKLAAGLTTSTARSRLPSRPRTHGGRPGRGGTAMHDAVPAARVVRLGERPGARRAHRHLGTPAAPLAPPWRALGALTAAAAAAG